MHGSMPYDPIQGQGHKTLKVRNSSIFKIYFLCHFQWELANDDWKCNVLLAVFKGKGNTMECGRHGAVKLLEHALNAIEHVFVTKLGQS